MKKITHFILFMKTNLKRVLTPAIVRAGAVFGLCTIHMNMVYADNAEDLGENALSAIEAVYKFIMTIAVPSAVVAGLACVVMMIFCKNDKTFQTSFTWLRRIAILTIVLLVLPDLFGWIIALFVEDSGNASKSIEEVKSW